MIILHNLKGTAFAINGGLIERVEGDAETHVMLVTGTSYVVIETVEEVVQLHREDRAKVQTLAGTELVERHDSLQAAPNAGLPLRLVSTPSAKGGEHR